MTSKRNMKSVFVALLLIAAGAVVISTLAPLAYAQSINLFPFTANPGTFVTIIGTGFNVADTNCTVTGPADLFVAAPICGINSGGVQASFTVKAGAPQGLSLITVTGSPNGDSASAFFSVPVQITTTSTTTSTTTTSVTSSTSTVVTSFTTSSSLSTTTVSSIGISTVTYTYYITQSILDQTTTSITEAPIFTIFSNTTQTVATTTVTTITNTTTTVTGFIIALLADNLNTLGLIALAVVFIPTLLRRFFV